MYSPSKDKSQSNVIGNYRIYFKEKIVILTHLESRKYIIFNKEDSSFKQISSIDEDKFLFENIDVILLINI